ncbi:unnamed protein product [Caenorhabditis bovis]|uniref:Uncharacterized protein n=1 Tax=Caenorhabditis bovis TaxID=2654633 RepID=A0A8S1EG51_9PELO|nr:unnamed protein product [Caenorhabditis bovis]
MVSRLTKAMSALSQNDEEAGSRRTERRKSARLNNIKTEKNETVHDSGTESDEEEMKSIALSRQMNGSDFFNTTHGNDYWSLGSPPPLSDSPPIPRDADTESWDSFGRESGIVTGDNDSDTDGASTPTPNRRRIMELEEESASVCGEKRRYSSMTTNDHPIAWRLRSFNNDATSRPVKVAARKIPVRVIYNRPSIQTPAAARDVSPDCREEASIEIRVPAPKRNRRNSHRPSLDFDKMVETRIQSSSPVPSQIVTRSQANNS